MFPAATSLDYYRHLQRASRLRAPLEPDFEELTRNKVIVEVAHRNTDHEEQFAFWWAEIVGGGGNLAAVRWLGARNGLRQTFLKIFVSSHEPARDELDERIHPVGYAAANGRRYRPPGDDFGDGVLTQLDGRCTIPPELNDIFSEENRCRFAKGMMMEAPDIDNFSVMRPVVVHRVIGPRMQLEYIDKFEGAPYCWFHQDDERIKPCGWSSHVGHTILAHPAYLEGTGRQLNKSGNPISENVAPPFDFRPILVPEPLIAFLDRFVIGSKVEVVDPQSQCIRRGTVAEVLRDNHLVIEVENELENVDNHRICLHASSGFLLSPGFSALWRLEYPVGPRHYRHDAAETSPRESFLRALPQHAFEVGQVLEVAAADLIRVGRIRRICGLTLVISILGLEPGPDCVLPMTYPDIHPVGWCDGVRHPL